MKKVKILTIVLAIIVIIMVGFFGIYMQKQNRMENKIKDYSYAMDLSGARSIRLQVSQENQTIVKDAEGKKVEDSENLTDEQITENGYTKEEVPYNAEEIKTIDNYKKSKEVIEKRLKQIGANNYIIKLNEQTGEIGIEVTEDEQIEGVLTVVNTIGKFEIFNDDTNEKILDNSNIKSAKLISRQQSEGTTIYLQVELNKEGKEKLEEVANITEENNQAQNETSNETNSETENTTTNETGNILNEQTNTGVTLKATLDDEEINSVSLAEQSKTGVINIPIGEATTNTQTLNQNANEASYIAFMINTGNIPLTYEMAENQYILSEITSNELQMVIYVGIAIVVIAIIILIIKYKLLGLLTSVSYVGFISTLMLLIRYTNVILSIEGLLGIAIILILNYILLNKLLKEGNTMETYKNFFIKILPIIILAITFCFIGWLPVSSFGMVMFWGIVLIALYNIILTNNLIKIKVGKEK